MPRFFAVFAAALWTILLILTCTDTSTNPFAPEKAGVSLILKGSNYIESSTTITDTIGRPVRVGVCLFLTQHIDSTEIVVSRSATQNDTVIICKKNDKMVDTAFYDITFTRPGIRNVKATAIIGKMLRQSTATITIIDRPSPNQAPKLSITGNRAIVAGDTCNLLVTASDPNPGQTLAIEGSGLPSAASFSDSILTWPTTRADTGSYSITFTVHDNGTPVMTDSKTVAITVTAPGVNRPPYFTSDSIPLAGFPGIVLSLRLDTMCSDPDGDSVGFSLFPGALTGVTINGSTWTFTPPASDTGVFSCFVLARDPAGALDTLTITLTITVEDRICPTLGLLSHPKDSSIISDSTCQVRISCNDASGIASVTCSRNGQSFKVTRTDTVYSATVAGLVAKQWNTITFIATDASLKANRSTLFVFLNYDPTLDDNVPPALSLLSPDADTIVSADSCIFSVTCTDASGIASVTITPGSGTPIIATRATPADNVFSAMVKSLTPGRFTTITITATDASTAANHSTVTVRAKYDNDRTAPTLRHHTPQGDSITISENSIAVRVIAIDASGIALTTCTMGSKSFAVSHSDSIYSATINGLAQNQWNHVRFIAMDSSLAANRCSLSVYLYYDSTMDDNTPPVIAQKGGPANGNVITDPIVTIVDSITDQSGMDSVYWTLNGVRAGFMTLVSGSTATYRLIDTLTAFRSNRIVVHAIDASTQRNRDSTGITLDYNLPPVINDTAVSTNRNAAKTWTLTARSPDNDPLTWSRLTSPSAASGTMTGILPSVTFAPSSNWAGVDSFRVRVSDGYWNDTAKITITVINVPVAPAIITHPQNLTRNAGQSASFSVAINGDVNPAPSYQWKQNGTDLSGAAANALTISSVTATDNGSYTVVVSNSAGSVTSNPAVLTVNYAPAITTQPQSQSRAIGQSVTFTVAAAGNPAPAYQWKKDGTDISGANNSSHTINSVTLSDSASYTVIATNTLGSVTSNPAVLTVNYEPVITVQPVSLQYRQGQLATFSVTTTGNPAPSYQWKKNDADIPGANSASYTINSLAQSDIASYTVTVTNTVGSVTSQPVTLIVRDLLAHWSFNSISGNAFADETGNGYDAVFSGTGVETASGIAGQALSCSGNDFEISALNSADAFNLYKISIEFWVNYTSLPDLGVLYTTSYVPPSGGPNCGYTVSFNKEGNIFFSMSDSAGSNWYVVTSGSVLTSSTWYHVVCSYDSNAMKIYINGALDKSLTHEGFTRPSEANANIGCQRRTDGNIYFPYNGKIDEMKLFNFALPADSVAAHYNASKP